MRISWPFEKEQTLCAIIERYGDGYQRALTGGKYPTNWTEDNVSWNIRVSKPVQVGLGIRSGKHACEADICSISLTIEVADDAH